MYLRKGESMKNFAIPFMIFTLLAAGTAFGADEYYFQKIGIAADTNSKYPGISVMIVKTLLSLSEDDTNLVLYPGDNSDLETLGIKELNGNVLVKTDKKGINYKIGLYLKGTTNVLIDDSVEFQTHDTVFSVKPAAMRVLGILEAQFPKKKIEEIKQVEEVKESVSEFETATPRFSIGLTPGYCEFNTSISLKDTNGMNSGNGFNTNAAFNNNGFSLEAEGLMRYRELNLWLGAGLYMMGKDNYTASGHIGGGYGIFGSLIILGVDADLFLNHFTAPGTGSFLSNTSPNISNTGTYANWTGADTSTILLCPSFQFNITKSYYIKFEAGIPLGLSSASIYFNQPTNTTVKTKLNNSNGPPYIKFVFSFEVVPNLRMNLEYFIYSTLLNFDKESDAYTSEYAVGNAFVNSFHYDLTQIGLGLQYEL